jgi:hypothetical protein
VSGRSGAADGRLEKGISSVTEDIEAVVVSHRRTATTSRFRQVEKAIENLYYALLLTGPDYAGKVGRWHRWANVGFDLTVREPPRDALRDDRIRIDIDPADAPRIPMTLREGNPEVKSQLAHLLHEVEKERAQRVDTPGTDEERSVEILATDAVQQTLVHPVLQSLGDDGVDGVVTGKYLQMLHDSVFVLTEANVTSVRVS